MSQEQNNSNPRRSIGALWEKLAKSSGKRFLSGSIEIGGQRYPIVVFPNTKKSKPNQPDYSILMQEQRQQEAPAQYHSDQEPPEEIPY